MRPEADVATAAVVRSVEEGVELLDEGGRIDAVATHPFLRSAILGDARDK
jgi:hypothetical protein